jgi:signal transduction histidine kinase
VCLHAEMLAEEDPPPERRRHLAEVVRAEGARLAALVDDLLDFAALERGARRLEPAPVDLSRAAREAAMPYATLGEREGVCVEAPRNGGVVALADPHALSRILANLLGNAWRHGRPARAGGPGRIRVSVADGPRPSVEVRDDGPGVPPGERALVFERFRRGRAAAGREGAGIGLSLSRDLARAMGGDLVVEDDGAETVFRLTLPAVEESPP